MPELKAFGKDNRQRCWQSIPQGESIVLGRAPRNGWSVPWDRLISREHAQLRLEGDRLFVEELKTARNPIFFDGKPSATFEVVAGGEFRIGETTFQFVGASAEAAGSDTIVEHALGTSPLKSGRFENAHECLETLCQLPGLIAESRSDVDFATKLTDMLLASLRGALAAAVIQVDADDDEGLVQSEPTLLRWNTRGESVGRFRPSRRLITQALERRQSVVHLWTDQDGRNSNFTMSCDLDWAFCTPIPTADNERWCLYVSGKRQFAGLQEIQHPDDLMAELRLAELMARFIGAVRQVRSLEQQQVAMRRFFSPAVVETLQGAGAGAALEPRQGPVSVLFCDVRGFSRKVEQWKDDLRPLLTQVSDALGVMTGSIMKYEGVIADFQGDAALAFWGWPSHVEDAAMSACRAALLIERKFREANQDPAHALYGFRIGIGVGFGDAIAGQIGSQEQIKVGVFGPVVNLASRLQNLTKQIGVAILVDGTTAAALAKGLPEGAERCRRIARLRPAGIDTPVDVHALVPHHAGDEGLSAAELRTYDEAVDAVIAGDWPRARDLLKRMPAQDGPSNFLRVEICRHDGAPPADWDGAFSLGR
ncbi:MAG: FHA domain-containing protein [Pirellulales bacterium]|nr:FHA domain-containing protein [Pirellulales bacterium]